MNNLDEKGKLILKIVIYGLIIIALAILLIMYTKNSNKIKDDTKTSKASLDIAMYFSELFKSDDKYNTEEQIQLINSIDYAEDGIQINFENGTIIKHKDNKLYKNDDVIIDKVELFNAKKNVQDGLEILMISYKLLDEKASTSTTFTYNHQVFEMDDPEKELDEFGINDYFYEDYIYDEDINDENIENIEN